jgi:hypothetical protein
MLKPVVIRICLAALPVLVASAASARNEAMVGQCGLTFVNTGDSCEKAFGGAGADPPDGDKLNACWDKATSDYNSCMDRALAAPAAALGGGKSSVPHKIPGGNLGEFKKAP